MRSSDFPYTVAPMMQGRPMASGGALSGQAKLKVDSPILQQVIDTCYACGDMVAALRKHPHCDQAAMDKAAANLRAAVMHAMECAHIQAPKKR